MKVAMLHTQNNGVGYYRSWMVEKWLKRLGLCETRRYPDDTPRVYWLKEHQPEGYPHPTLEEMVGWADVAVMTRVDQLEHTAHYEAMRDYFGNKLVVDIDDHLYGLNVDNPSYSAFQGDVADAVQVNDEPPVNKPYLELDLPEGKRYMGVIGNDVRRVAEIQMTIANRVTVSTPYLKRLYRKLNANIVTIPNAIDFEDFAPTPKANDGTVRIGYAGGNAHFYDLHSIWDVLVAICEKHPKVKLVLMNCPYDYIDKIPAEQREMHEFCTIQEWPQRFRDLRFDIGIAPLVDTPFNRGKSNLKFLENATQNTPTVCSAVEPFLNTVIHEQNGWIARTQQEWFEGLSTLIKDKAERARMGQRAYNAVHINWNAEKMARRWYKAFEEVV